MKKLLKEFRDFALKGNMFDLAVGVIIGGAFNGLVSSLVSNIIMPVLTLITGKIDFSNMFIALNGEHYATLEAAKEVTSVFAYGLFLTELLNFIIMAFVVFLVVKKLNSLRHEPKAPAPMKRSVPSAKQRSIWMPPAVLTAHPFCPRRTPAYSIRFF